MLWSRWDIHRNISEIIRAQWTNRRDVERRAIGFLVLEGIGLIPISSVVRSPHQIVCSLWHRLESKAAITVDRYFRCAIPIEDWIELVRGNTASNPFPQTSDITTRRIVLHHPGKTPFPRLPRL